MRRTPAVASQFYPGDGEILSRELQQLIPAVEPGRKQKALAVICPHAGYVYSGEIAGETFSQVIIPQDMVILGPNHHGRGARIALMGQGSWAMPLGDVPINEELGRAIAMETSEVAFDNQAHTFEHSLEVQVPFLQFLRPDMTITPIVISHIPYAVCADVGKALAQAIRHYRKPVLIVASTDMTHYETREAATRKDRLAIDRITALDQQGLYDTVLGNRITMCGIMPTTVALIAAKELGATVARLVRYTDSGEKSGDINRVVGYAGFVVS